MKRVILSLLAAVVLVFSCSKDDPAPTTPTTPAFAVTPEAKAEHDNKSGGVYKGTFANETSSGSIKVVLQDGKTEVTLIYNGTTKILTTSALSGWTSGDAIAGATFTNGSWIVIFSADGDAANFEYGLSIDGTVDFGGVIAKEKSTALIKVYEGTYAGDASGKWNFVTQGNSLAGFYTVSGQPSPSIEGAIGGNDISISSPGTSVIAEGTFASETTTCSGNWQDDSSTGTWSGARKI